MTPSMQAKNEKKYDWVKLFYLFLSGGLVGWIYEVTLGFIYGHGFVNRGYLSGPYLPIYGFGLLLLYLLLQGLIKKTIVIKGIKITPILVFLGIVMITTCLELIVGYVLLEKFALRLWDYRTYWMNYMGIISFNTSVRFGIGGMFLLYALAPFLDQILGKISLKRKRGLLMFVLATMVIDFFVTALTG